MENLISCEKPWIEKLDSHKVMKVYGEDAREFLDGQVTANIKSMMENHFEPFCRLCPRGRIKFNGHICATSEYFLVIVESEYLDQALKDLRSFIIAEDVYIEAAHVPSNLYNFNMSFYESLDLSKKKTSSDFLFVGTFNLFPGFLYFSDIELLILPAEEGFRKIKNLLSYNSTGQLFNECLSSLCQTHQSKGCYVGQEVVKKIDNNRGARKFPILILLEDTEKLNKVLYDETLGIKISMNQGSEVGFIKYQKMNGTVYFLVTAPRDLREDKETISIQINQLETFGSTIVLKDAIKKMTIDFSDKCFLNGVDGMNSSLFDIAEKYFTLAIASHNTNKEAIESLGVLYGRQSNYKKAHDMMDLLLQVDPTSVMAHTNKSLFYMNEGKIDEAEREKELALINGQGIKKLDVEDSKSKNKRLEKQLDMYLEVVEIDPDDDYALNKAVEIYCELDRVEEGISLLDKRKLTNDPALFELRLRMLKQMDKLDAHALENLDDMIRLALKNGDDKIAKCLKTYK